MKTCVSKCAVPLQRKHWPNLGIVANTPCPQGCHIPRNGSF
uniref:Uncharacterized protein n=1 Tax=Anguilla anguilla TaxID=7936 RepID=A0A0E9QAX7_ANGAN